MSDYPYRAVLVYNDGNTETGSYASKQYAVNWLLHHIGMSSNLVGVLYYHGVLVDVYRIRHD